MLNLKIPIRLDPTYRKLGHMTGGRTLNDSVKRMGRTGGCSVSWSRYSQFHGCQTKWFATNFAEFCQTELKRTEGTFALSGTIIQKLFEIFVNKRLYKSDEFDTLKSINKWFDIQSKALYYLLRFEYDSYNSLPVDTFRDFYSTSAAGKERVKLCIKEHNLDRRLIKDLSPCFIDDNVFLAIHGSEERYLEFLSQVCKKTLDSWVESELNLDLMLSEVTVKSKFNKRMTSKGIVDFIYNLNHRENGEFNKLSQLEGGYVVIDGKFSDSAFVKKDQLMFYATLLYRQKKKLPSYVSFFIWREAKFKVMEFNPEFGLEMREGLAQIGDKVDEIMAELKERVMEEKIWEIEDKECAIYLEDITSLERTPSNSECVFCPLAKACPVSKASGASIADMQSHRKGREAIEEIKKKHRDENGGEDPEIISL